MASQLAERSSLAVLPHGLGRGPGGRPTGLRLPSDRCPVIGCRCQIDLARLMCRDHWYRLPKHLRDRIWATWRSGEGASSPEHQQTVLAAIRYCAPRNFQADDGGSRLGP
jgi:hypothetical protein